jgi:hypothetical protein
MDFETATVSEIITVDGVTRVIVDIDRQHGRWYDILHPEILLASEYDCLLKDKSLTERWARNFSNDDMRRVANQNYFSEFRCGYLYRQS